MEKLKILNIFNPDLLFDAFRPIQSSSIDAIDRLFKHLVPMTVHLPGEKETLSPTISQFKSILRPLLLALQMVLVLNRR